MDARLGLWRKLTTEELILLNCGVGEDSWESLGLQGDLSWVFIGRTDAEAESPILWPPHEKSWLIGKDWCWEGLGAGGEGDDQGWDGWMASRTRRTWVWVNSRRWWWTGRLGVLWFMGSQRVGHHWATELNWTQPDYQISLISFPHFEHGLKGSYNSLSLNPSFEDRETEAYKGAETCSRWYKEFMQSYGSESLDIF